MTNRGRWSERGQYRAGDVVTVSGRSWVAFVDNSDIIPGTNTNIWRVQTSSTIITTSGVQRQGSNYNLTTDTSSSTEWTLASIQQLTAKVTDALDSYRYLLGVPFITPRAWRGRGRWVITQQIIVQAQQIPARDILTIFIQQFRTHILDYPNNLMTILTGVVLPLYARKIGLLKMGGGITRRGGSRFQNQNKGNREKIITED